MLIRISFFTRLGNQISRLFLTTRHSIEKNGFNKAFLNGWHLIVVLYFRKVQRFRSRHVYRQRLQELKLFILQHDDFFDIIHVPIGWNTLMFQRYQHLSLQFARLGGFAFYGGNPQVDKDLFVYKMVSEKLCVFDATDHYLVKKILCWLQKKSQPKIIRIQSIDLQTTLDEISSFLKMGFTVIYEYIDMISPVITGIVPRFVTSRHLGILEDNRILVVATANRLIEDVKKFRTRNYLLSTNGVDLDHWRYPQTIFPDDLRKIISTGKPIVGYHGTLAEWVDYDLLRVIAETGKYELVLLGLEHDSSFKKSGLKEYPNVHFLGSKSYFELNGYASCYDVAILPFIKNELTDSISPVKIFEYMAAQKPVIATDLVECAKYKSCLIAKNSREFLGGLEIAIQLRKDPQYLALLNADAQNNSWEQKAIDLLIFAGVKPE